MDIQTYNVKLNMKDSGVVSSGIRLKQGDSFMRLLFTIMSGGTEYFDENDIPVVYFRRPDGTTIFGSAGIDTNGYYYEFKGNELQIAGNILCDVKFTLEDGRESTATFTFEVVTDTVSNHTEGHGVYDLDLAEMIKEVEKFAPTVEGYATAAEGYAIDAHNSAIAAEKAAQEAGAGSGANKVDFDDTTRTLSILRDSIVIDSTVIPGGGSADVPIATTTVPGIVKPDGTTITVDADGTIHSAGGGGTSDYNNLSNKPTLDGTTIEGNMTADGLGLATIETLETVSSNIMGSDAYNPSTSYAENDTCIDENTLWECLVPCSGIKPSTDDGTHWEKVTLAEISKVTQQGHIRETHVSSETIALVSNQWKDVATITLDKGVYSIVAHVTFNMLSSTTPTHAGVGLFKSDNTYLDTTNAYLISVPQNAMPTLLMTDIIEIPTDNFQLKVRALSGVARNVVLHEVKYIKYK